jgi:transcriptional repressor NrdR
MKCPYCQTRDSRVIDSREVVGGESIRRRRECVVCARRFTTYERVELSGLMVVKKDGRRQEFDPAKLRQKLRIALTKRPVGEQEIETIVQKVEAELHAMGTSEIPSSAIGESALQHLKELDQVAYIRFASVYREFADLEDLRREVEGLSEIQRKLAEAVVGTS